jgi:hypothetical protein
MPNPSRRVGPRSPARAARVVWPLAILLTLSACSANSARNASESEITGGGGSAASGGSSGASGSGTGDSSSLGGGFMVSEDAGGRNDCGGETFPLARKPAKVLFVLDRSGSMRDPPDGATASTSKWDLTVPAVNEVITQTDARISWGLKTFPEGDTTSCIVTDPVDVPIAPANAATVTAKVTSTTPNGNGTPTGDVMKAAVKYLQSLDAAGDTDQKFVLLATDGEPSCVAGTETSQTSSRPYAVQAVTDAATAGYKTFVVGVATTKTNATQALNDMANAGGEARPDPNPLATKFYLANTKDELVAALVAITGVIVDCRFSLSSPPPDGEHVGVLLGADRVPPDLWSFTSADKMTIEVTGASCDQIKSGTAEALRVVFGCPQDPIR